MLSPLDETPFRLRLRFWSLEPFEVTEAAGERQPVFDATAAMVAAMLELTVDEEETLLGFSGMESPELIEL
jgi:hypothetical protein